MEGKGKILIFAANNDLNLIMSESEKSRNVLQQIKEVAMRVMPKGSKVILFGSRARGDERSDSDWDLLVLLDKDKIQDSDHDLYTYPFWELGWSIDAMIHPVIYTLEDWAKKNNPIFRYNVERDGILIC